MRWRDCRRSPHALPSSSMRSRSSRSMAAIRSGCARVSTSRRSGGKMPDMDADGDVARPSLNYAAIAEKLLAHRLAQPDLSPSGDNEKTALPHAFRRLAEVFALDNA